MSSKRKLNESVSVSNKRKWLTLEQKLDVVKLHEKGASKAKIAREKNINESSVRLIIKKKDIYKKHGIATASSLSKTVFKNRSTILEKMEQLLSIWIEVLNKKRIPLSQMEIQAKARSLFSDLNNENGPENKEGGETSINFSASRGWFHRFKKRIDLHNTLSVHDNLCDEESPKIELIIPKNDPEELLKATIETSSIHDNLCDEESPKMELIIPKNDPEVLLNATIEAFRPKRIVPLRDKILIEMNPTDNSMSETSQVVSGKVIAVGSGIITEAGELLPMSVDVGDEVLLPVNGGTKMNSDGKEYFFFKDSDILAKYEMDYD